MVEGDWEERARVGKVGEERMNRCMDEDGSDSVFSGRRKIKV